MDGRRGGADVDWRSYELGALSAFAEVVAAGVKRLALSRPLTAEQADTLAADARAIAASFGVECYRDESFQPTDLFPAAYSAGKQVFVLALLPALADYHTLKADLARLAATGDAGAPARAELARRFGRLLSYPEAKIAAMIARQQAAGGH